MRKLASAAFANAYLLLSLTSLFWSGNMVVGRAVAGHVPPIALAWSRWLIAFLIVLPFALPYLRRDWPTIRAHAPMLVFLGLTGVTAFNTLAYIALNHTTAINAVVLQSSGPVMIVLACFLLFGDRFGVRQAVGLGASLVGVLIVVARGDPATLADLTLNRGDLLMFVGLALWAVYTAYLRKRPPIHWLSLTAVTFGVAVLFLTPMFAVEHALGWRLQATWSTGAAILYVAVFPSIFAYAFFNRGVELIGGGRAGVFQHLVPLFGTVLAIGFLGESLRSYHLIGFVLILAGVAMAARGRARPA